MSLPENLIVNYGEVNRQSDYTQQRNKSRTPYRKNHSPWTHWQVPWPSGELRVIHWWATKPVSRPPLPSFAVIVNKGQKTKQQVEEVSFPLYQLVSPVTEWGKGKAASAQRRRKRPPLGMISAQRLPQLDRRGRAYHPRGMTLLLKGHQKRAGKWKNVARWRESIKKTVW